MIPSTIVKTRTHVPVQKENLRSHLKPLNRRFCNYLGFKRICLGVLTQESIASGKQFLRSAASSVLAGQKHGPHFAAQRQNRTVCSNSPLDCSWLRHRTPSQPQRVRRFREAKCRRMPASRHRRKAILIGFPSSASKIAFPEVLRSFDPAVLSAWCAKKARQS